MNILLNFDEFIINEATKNEINVKNLWKVKTKVRAIRDLTIPASYGIPTKKVPTGTIGFSDRNGQREFLNSICIIWEDDLGQTSMAMSQAHKNIEIVAG